MTYKSCKTDEWVLAGTIVGTKGLDGSLKVLAQISIRFNEPIPCLVGFSLNFAREYSIERWKQSKSRYSYVKLKYIDTIEEAKKLIEKGIYVKKSSTEILTSEVTSHDDLDGFLVIDMKDHAQIGKVIGIEENPGNNLLIIEKEEKIIYIPFVEQFIYKIDQDKKTVFIKSIEGLLDI